MVLRYVIHQLAILGVAAITKGMATVVINDIQCGVTYNITAEGMLNETLVGSRSSHGSIAPRPCPMISSECETLVYIILCTIIFIYMHVHIVSTIASSTDCTSTYEYICDRA